MITKPMLAATAEDPKLLVFPKLATPKLDGIRCLKINGRVLSRKFKDIPNEHVRQAMLQLPDGLDGELMVPGANFNDVQSAIMSMSGEPKFEYWVFDYVSTSVYLPYAQRIDQLSTLALPNFCLKLLPVEVKTQDELDQLESQYLAQGYEGVMLRSPHGPYKCGRSTEREGYLLKVKRFMDSEAIVLDFEERLHNANEATIDELGHTKRSSHKENMVPMDTLGAFVVRDMTTNLVFRVATGLDDAQRNQIWKNREHYRGKILKYKFQSAGMKELPRFPVFLGFRHPDDMS